MFWAVFMLFFVYIVCALLGVDTLQSGLAEGNSMTSHSLLDQVEVGVYRGKRHIRPILGL